jgi:hypothetical protein
MPRVRKIIFLLFLMMPFLCLYGQQYLVVQKAGGIKNFKYETDKPISIQTAKGDFVIEGRISKITDTTVFIDNLYEIKYSNIQTVLRPRVFWKRLSKLFFIRGGIAYATIVGINGLINNDSPIIDEQTLIISAVMVATGFALRPFYVKKMDIGEKWKFKVLDFERLEMDAGEQF